MSASATARRVTVVAPTTRLDVALPPESPIAEIVPQLTGLAGLPGHDPTGASQGWLLSRLGEQPFEPARSVAASGIADGDLLYLTARSEQQPPAVFDDMIEAVAHAAEDLPGTWRPVTTRHAGLVAASLALLLALAVLAGSGLAPLIPSGICAAVAVALLVAGGLVARAVGDGDAGALLALLAQPWVAAAVLLGTLGAPSSAWLGREALLLAGALVTVWAVLGSLATAAAIGWFTGSAAVAVLGAAAAFGAVVSGAAAPSVAAITAASVTALTPVLPMLALRLGRVRLPGVPADVEEFRGDRPSTRLDDVSPATARADACLTALYVAGAVVIGGCVGVLLRTGQPWSTVLACVLTLAAGLRMRTPLRGRTQRLALYTLGLAGATAVVARLGVDRPGIGRAVLALALIVLAVIVVAVALRAPHRAASPYWGRFYDIVEFVALAAILPLTAQVLGLFARVRGFGG